MKYHFKTHKEDNGFWAEGIELPGCFTQGDTIEELLENMKEALNLYIDEPSDSDDLADLPDNNIKLNKNIVEVPVDPLIEVRFLIRYRHIQSERTQSNKALKLYSKNLKKL